MMVKGKGSLPGQRIQGNKELVVIRNLSPIFCEILYSFLGLPVSGHSSLILVFRQPTSPYRRADEAGMGFGKCLNGPALLLRISVTGRTHLSCVHCVAAAVPSFVGRFLRRF